METLLHHRGPKKPKKNTTHHTPSLPLLPLSMPKRRQFPASEDDAAPSHDESPPVRLPAPAPPSPPPSRSSPLQKLLFANPVGLLLPPSPLCSPTKVRVSPLPRSPLVISFPHITHLNRLHTLMRRLTLRIYSPSSSPMMDLVENFAFGCGRFYP